TPPDLAGMLVLGAIGIVVARRVEIEKPWREAVNLYVLAVLAPGERKSPVFSQVFGPIEQLERELIETSADARREAKAYRDAKIKLAQKRAADAVKADDERALVVAKMEEQKAKELPVPVEPRLIAADVTPEALPSVMQEQGGRIALLADEGGLFETIA